MIANLLMENEHEMYWLEFLALVKLFLNAAILVEVAYKLIIHLCYHYVHTDLYGYSLTFCGTNECAACWDTKAIK